MAPIALLAHTHMPKGARRLPQRCAELIAGAEALIHAGDFQIFNPGSPTERRRAPCRSMGMLHVEKRGLRFEHVWL